VRPASSLSLEKLPSPTDALTSPLAALDVPKRFVQPASQYDFSASSDVRLVHSTQGKYSLAHDEKKGGGLASLASAVQALGLALPPGPGGTGLGRWEVEATGSSIGRYTPAWLSQMLGACAGALPSSYFGAGKGRNAPAAYPVPAQGQPVRLPIRIVFPTEGEITGSFNGAPVRRPLPLLALSVLGATAQGRG